MGHSVSAWRLGDPVRRSSADAQLFRGLAQAVFLGGHILVCGRHVGIAQDIPFTGRPARLFSIPDCVRRSKSWIAGPAAAKGKHGDGPVAIQITRGGQPFRWREVLL